MSTPYSLYDLSTGLFTGQRYTGGFLLSHVHSREGIGAIEGHHDHLSKRVDLASVTARDEAIAAAQAALDALPLDALAERLAANAALEAARVLPIAVIEYQPPAPADDAEKTWAWDDTIKRWTPTVTLGAVKRLQRQRVKAAAEATNQIDITIAGNVLNADSASRALLFQKMQIALMAAQDGQAFSVDWMLADDTVVPLNANQTKAIVRAINTREDAIRAKAHTLLAAIKSATTAEEVLAIVWSFP